MAELLRIESLAGRSLEDILFDRGVEFPCGGTALCGGCRIRVLAGDIPATSEMAEVLTEAELREGWRLACRAQPAGPVVLDVGQWHTPVLSDNVRLEFEPRDGFGIAIDIGTTTVAGQILHLGTGEVLDVRTALNPQCRHGSDLMSRIGFDLANPGVLGNLIRESIGRMVAELAAGRPVREVLLAGNTVMHHLYCGFDVSPLAAVPFETPRLGGQECGKAYFLPCLGSFVGSDILAGIAATGLHTAAECRALLDLGTNGEIVLGSSAGLLCSSTAAGPAFEAGRIRMGMRAASGAIHRVATEGGAIEVHVLGGGQPRGICGSGLVDAAAAGLELGRITRSGRFSNGAREWLLAPGIPLTQSDIRELQLAKGAIAAGLALLSRRLVQPTRIHLAGAFGNYVDVRSARQIGLLPSSEVHVEPAGNTSLRGLKQLLLSPSRRDETIEAIRRMVQHVPLASEPGFADTFADCMALDRLDII